MKNSPKVKTIQGLELSTFCYRHLILVHANLEVAADISPTGSGVIGWRVCSSITSIICGSFRFPVRIFNRLLLELFRSAHSERPLRGNPAAMPRNCRVLGQVRPANCAADASGGLVPHRGHSCSTQRMAASVSLIESKTFSSPDHKPLAFMN